MIAATLRARRVTAGAIVTVQRADGRCHRHHVSLKRYHRLHDILLSHRGVTGAAFLRHGFECNLFTVQGFADARSPLERFHSGTRRSQPASCNRLPKPTDEPGSTPCWI